MKWTDTPFIQWREIGQFEFDVLIQHITLAKRTEIGLFDDMDEYETILQDRFDDGWFVVVQSKYQPNPLRWQREEATPPTFVRRILLLARPAETESETESEQQP